MSALFGQRLNVLLLYSAKKNGKIKKTVEKRTHADAALESHLNFADAAAFFFPNYILEH